MFKDSLSYLANKFQSFLFPIVEISLDKDELLDPHYRVIQTLELLQIERFLPSKALGLRGRPQKHGRNIVRAFIAKHVLNLKTTSQIIHRLQIDKNLRYICGWEPGQRIPAKSTFSRVFQMLAESNALERLHDALAKETFKDHVVLHNARDSMPIPCREWPKDINGQKIKKRKVKKEKSKVKTGKETVCAQQVSKDFSVEEMLAFVPTKCDIGRKMNSSGKAFCWRGYKLHLDVAEGWFPLSFAVTSASTHDTQTSIPLSKKSAEKCSVLYELMDSAYDSQVIRDYIESNGRKALIVERIWSGERGEAIKQEEKAQKNLRWRPAEKQRLRYRMMNERLFARLKDHFSGADVWVRGYAKVKCHMALSILALASSEILRFL